jgi:chromate transporter
VPTAPPSTVVREWGRIGLLGFGGPPAHIALLRELVVERRGWLTAREFEDANAASGLLRVGVHPDVDLLRRPVALVLAGGAIEGLAAAALGLRLS